jgi:hypothetical protein
MIHSLLPVDSQFLYAAHTRSIRWPGKLRSLKTDYWFLTAVKNLFPEHATDIGLFPVGNVLGDSRNPDNATLVIPDG